jgi:two-component system, LytTR family, sensor kinase
MPDPDSRTDRSSPSLAWSWWSQLGLIFGVWTAISLLYAGAILVEVEADGATPSAKRIVVYQLLYWNLWTCLTPLVLWLGKRYPLEHSSWKRSLPKHVLSFVGIMCMHSLVATYLFIAMRPFGPGSGTAPFLTQWKGRLLGGSSFAVVIYGGILGAGYAVEYYRKYRERESQALQLKAQLAEAQLQSLRMQLQPHFLFNTLNGIAGLVRTHENKAAVDMISGLSQLLRHALANSDRQEVTMREELDFLELYLDIEQMRFSDRLTVEMDIEPDTLEALVPNLILQPLAENAIRHGIARQVSAGTVRISARIQSGLLKINIYDDGPGLTAKADTDGNGIGLSNTRERLERLYGEKFKFDVRNRESRGVEVTLNIPLRFAPQ